MDPHFRKDVNNSREVVIDDPLSQNPGELEFYCLVFLLILSYI